MLYSNISGKIFVKYMNKETISDKRLISFKMSTFRLILTLRSALLATKHCRIVLPSSRMSFRSISSIDLYSYVPIRTQQICWFSSSTILHARRRDKIDANVTEEFDNEEEEEVEEEDSDTDQVILSFCFIR
jgi:hypothetical protein